MGSAENTILVVEDDIDVREAFTELLELEGYTVVGAANGLEALDRLRGGPRPAVIVLDLMMPGMDGRQFRQVQLQDPALAAIPVIIVSADASVDSKAAEVGAAAWFRKPVDAIALFDAVARLC